MKRYILILLLILVYSRAIATIILGGATGRFQRGPEYHDCAYDLPLTVPTETIYLWGDVQIVKDHSKADILVYIATNNDYADMVITFVTSKPSGCGEWRIVNKNADFTICFVSSPDDADLIVRKGDAKKEYYSSDPF